MQEIIDHLIAYDFTDGGSQLQNGLSLCCVVVLLLKSTSLTTSLRPIFHCNNGDRSVVVLCRDVKVVKLFPSRLLHIPDLAL